MPAVLLCTPFATNVAGGRVLAVLRLTLDLRIVMDFFKTRMDERFLTYFGR